VIHKKKAGGGGANGMDWHLPPKCSAFWRTNITCSTWWQTSTKK